MSRKKTIQLFQLGTGNVGQALIRAVKVFNRQSDSIRLNYFGFADSKTVYTDETGLVDHAGDPGKMLELIRKSADKEGDPWIVIDVTASDDTTDLLIRASELGAGLVLANKKPLVQGYAAFRKLSAGRLGYRATVGAGLPVIETIHSLQAEGESIQTIEACLSGSLGTLFTSLERGKSFSKTLRGAHQRGFTEPDPREDLSGLDVARKMLIIARTLGIQMELSGIDIHPVEIPAKRDDSVEQFLENARAVDESYKQRIRQLRSLSRTLRYVAELEGARCQVGLKEVDRTSALGRLRKDGKAIVIQTLNQSEPIVVMGAGSGAEDTARDLIRDLLDVGRGT